jgi:homoserine dehydrogenase
MIVDNMDFNSALSLAQEKGYAEKNPAADIEGHDACRKVCILAALAFGKHVYPEQVYTEGITEITLDDVEAADSFGYVIKLIGNTKKLPDGRITASVRPTLVSRECIISGVNGVFNAVMVNGDQTGDVMFYGKGAGKEATASAVVADMIDCAKHLEARKYLYWTEGNKDYVVTDYDKYGKFFVRIMADDYERLLEQYGRIFADKQLGCIKNEFTKEISFITSSDTESNINKKLQNFEDSKIKVLHILG